MSSITYPMPLYLQAQAATERRQGTASPEPHPTNHAPRSSLQPANPEGSEPARSPQTKLEGHPTAQPPADLPANQQHPVLNLTAPVGSQRYRIAIGEMCPYSLTLANGAPVSRWLFEHDRKFAGCGGGCGYAIHICRKWWYSATRGVETLCQHQDIHDCLDRSGKLTLVAHVRPTCDWLLKKDECCKCHRHLDEDKAENEDEEARHSQHCEKGHDNAAFRKNVAKVVKSTTKGCGALRYEELREMLLPASAEADKK